VHVCVHLLCSHLPACVLFARTPSKRGLWFALHVLLWGENKQRLAGTRLPTPPCVPGPLRHIEFPLFSHSAVMYIHLHTRLVCVLVCAVSALCSNAPPPLPQKLLVCVFVCVCVGRCFGMVWAVCLLFVLVDGWVQVYQLFSHVGQLSNIMILEQCTWHFTWGEKKNQVMLYATVYWLKIATINSILWWNVMQINRSNLAKG
jgi:hypothetical protein